MANGDDPKNKRFSYKDLQKTSTALGGVGGTAFMLKGLDAAGFKGWNTTKAIPPAERVESYNLAGTYGHLSNAKNPISGQTSLAGDYNQPAIGDGETNALGTFTSARNSFAGKAQSYFSHLTGTKAQRTDTGKNWSWGYGDTNVSMTSPVSGKNVLTGVTNVAKRMGYDTATTDAQKNRIWNQLQGRIKNAARIAKFGRPESISPIFKRDGVSVHQKDVDFNPYPNYDNTQKIHTPKPEVPHVYSTDQTSGKKKKGPGLFSKITNAVDDLNLFRPARYKGAKIVGKKRSRSGPSFKYRGGRGGGRRRN
jgi:hypothetical protein